VVSRTFRPRSSGFHVFAPNFRGSDGYGAEFRDLNIGDLGGGDLEDVQYAAKHAQQVLGLKSKPAAVGGSYGGYLTLMALMIHPDDWGGRCGYRSSNRLCERVLRGTMLTIDLVHALFRWDAGGEEGTLSRTVPRLLIWTS